MKLLKCKLCAGEIEIIGNENCVLKKIKCKKCGYSNVNDFIKKEPEIVIIKKRINS